MHFLGNGHSQKLAEGLLTFFTVKYGKVGFALPCITLFSSILCYLLGLGDFVGLELTERERKGTECTSPKLALPEINSPTVICFGENPEGNSLRK